MSDIKFNLDTTDLNAALGRILTNVGKEEMAALTAEAELIMTDAKKNTPVDTGTLRSSGIVTPRPADHRVDLSFGGAASAYAAIVHERLDVHHPVGEAKFLENALNRWRSGGGIQRLGARLGKAMQ